MQGRSLRLRPLSIADILDETVELYRNNFALLIGITAILQIPTIAISALQIHSVKQSYSWLYILIWLLTSPLLAGALTYAISDCYLNRHTSIRSCLRRTFRSATYWSLLGVVIVTSLIYTVSIIIAAIPVGIITAVANSSSFSGFGSIVLMMTMILFAAILSAPFWARLAIAEPTVIIERCGTSKALTRSWNLTKNDIVKITMVIITVYIIVLLIPTAVNKSITLIYHTSFYNLPTMARGIAWGLGSIFTIVLAPLIVVARVFLYYDARVRKEGLDLELLSLGFKQQTSSPFRSISVPPVEETIDPK